MSMDRRAFLKQASYAPGLMLLACKTVGRTGADTGSALKFGPINASVPKRKSWSRLNETEKAAFIAAVTKMKDTVIEVPDSFGSGGARKLDRWMAQAQVHQWYCSHNNWSFLSWHRGYLYHFELALRDIIGPEIEDFRLPYWDWSADQEIPIELQDAAFLKKLEVTRDSNTIASRGKKGSPQSAVWWQDAPNQILACPDFDTIGGDLHSSGLIEGPYHNMVHVGVGGDMGRVPFAAKDPIFWLHHCNVDRLWSLWMDKVIAAAKAEGDPKKKAEIIRQLFPSVDVRSWLNETYSNHFWLPNGTLNSRTNQNSLFTEDLEYNYDTMAETWTVSDVPSDQATVESTASVETVEQSTAPSLHLADVPGSELVLGFSWPKALFDSPQKLLSLRLKIAGVPEPKDSKLSFSVSLVLGSQVFKLPEIAFFPGANETHHKGQVGLSMVQIMNELRSLASSQSKGQVVLVLKDSAGVAVPIADAVPGFSTSASSYGLNFKAVYI